jgi:uncharacterized protein (UPF0335 family)
MRTKVQAVLSVASVAERLVAEEAIRSCVKLPIARNPRAGREGKRAKMSEASIGDNGQLRSYVERISKLHEERKQLGDDVADVLQEAASGGFDKAALKETVKVYMEPEEKRAKRAQKDDALSTYLAALGLAQ